jgi:hypothetical protein
MNQRLDTQQMLETFRANHRDPRNLAMHAVGLWFVFRALKRLVTGHLFTAAVNLGAGLALLVGGHEIEGTDAFSVFRQIRAQRSGDGQPAVPV